MIGIHMAKTKSIKSSNSLRSIQQSSTKLKSKIKRPKLLPATRSSESSTKKKVGWINRQRVLILASRGVSNIGRHLMKDLVSVMPHSRTDSKLDNKRNLTVLNEIADMGHCNKVLFFEARKKRDLYLWLSCTPNGPSVKFLIENIHTTAELKLSGNCLKASRPILAFDPAFSDDSRPSLKLLREMFVQAWGTPNQHPRSQPFVDKTFVFGYFDNRIWFRCYQIAEESGALVEIGPRFSLHLIRIFAGSFLGAVLYSNPNYVSPNVVFRSLNQQKGLKYAARIQAKTESQTRKKNRTRIFQVDELDDVFA